MSYCHDPVLPPGVSSVAFMEMIRLCDETSCIMKHNLLLFINESLNIHISTLDLLNLYLQSNREQQGFKYAGKELFFFNCSNFTSESYLIHLKTKWVTISLIKTKSVHIQSVPSEEKGDLCLINSGFYIIILILYTNK